MAVRIDSALAPGANPLISSLQLGRGLGDGGGGAIVSAPITKKAVETGAAAARGMQTAPVTRDPGLGRWTRQLAGLAVLAAAMVALWPGEMRTSAWRLTNPMACGPSPVQLIAGPGDVELDAGSDLVVEAAVTGTDAAPELRVRKRGGVWRRAAMIPAGPSSRRLPGSFVDAPADLMADEGDDEGEPDGGDRTPAVTVETPYGPRELPRH